jgi:hypothetical protein
VTPSQLVKISYNCLLAQENNVLVISFPYTTCLVHENVFSGIERILSMHGSAVFEVCVCEIKILLAHIFTASTVQLIINCMSVSSLRRDVVRAGRGTKNPS